MENYIIGADIGGSHITCQLFSPKTFLPLEGGYSRISVNSKNTGYDILDTWAFALQQAAKNYHAASPSAIGIAMPGPFDYQKGIGWFKEVDKFENLYNVNVKSGLIARLKLPSEFPLRFLNDAACFAIGEAWHGEASNYKRIIALTLGSGFGSTFISNGLPVAGIDGIPKDGFLYHIPFKQSIADDYFSTRWFINKYREMTGKNIQGVFELVNQKPVEPAVTTLFNEFSNNLCNFLLPWIKIFKTECLVLGGNIAKSFPLFLSDLIACFQNNNAHPKISISKLQENAALLGAARLCNDTFYSRVIQTLSNPHGIQNH